MYFCGKLKPRWIVWKSPSFPDRALRANSLYSLSHAQTPLSKFGLSPPTSSWEFCIIFQDYDLVLSSFFCFRFPRSAVFTLLGGFVGIACVLHARLRVAHAHWAALPYLSQCLRSDTRHASRGDSKNLLQGIFNSFSWEWQDESDISVTRGTSQSSHSIFGIIINFWSEKGSSLKFGVPQNKANWKKWLNKHQFLSPCSRWTPYQR